jgi:hypothetical protein
MKTEDQIKLEIRNELLELTDNMATIILIESKISDLSIEVFKRGFKIASDAAISVVNAGD